MAASLCCRDKGYTARRHFLMMTLPPIILLAGFPLIIAGLHSHMPLSSTQTYRQLNPLLQKAPSRPQLAERLESNSGCCTSTHFEDLCSDNGSCMWIGAFVRLETRGIPSHLANSVPHSGHLRSPSVASSTIRSTKHLTREPFPP